MKQLKDYLHLHIGCKVRYVGMANDRTLTAYWLGSLLMTEAWKNITPILRPLSDMTEKEKGEFCKTYNYSSKNILPEIETGPLTNAFYSTRTAQMTHYLLSNGFDIFGLIEAGLAIDKTKIKNNDPTTKREI